MPSASASARVDPAANRRESPGEAGPEADCRDCRGRADPGAPTGRDQNWSIKNLINWSYLSIQFSGMVAVRKAALLMTAAASALLEAKLRNQNGDHEELTWASESFLPEQPASSVGD
jgi:hypothetical protein